MAETRVLRTRGSHLYPGAQVMLDGGVPEAAGPCIVEFADGSAAAGEVAPEGDGRLRLATAPYRTAAGTAIPEKRWLLERGGTGEWRVAGAAPGRSTARARAYLTEAVRGADTPGAGGLRSMLFLELAAGLALLVVGGDLLVRGAVAFAMRLRVSPLLIGLTIVGFGTSTPELVTSLQAAFAGSPGIAIGNVVGSNTANILLILGLAAVMSPIPVARPAFLRDGTVAALAALRRQPDIAFGNVVGSNIYNVLGILGVTAAVHPIPVPPEIASFDIWVMLAATAALTLAAVTGWRITRAEGAAMLASYGVYVAVLVAGAAP